MSSTPGFFAAGVSSVQLDVELHSTAVAGALPNSKRVVPAPIAKPLPVTVTLAPPAAGPFAGLTPATTGASYLNRSWVEGELEPLGVVTLTSTVPEVPGGEVAVIDVAESTVNWLAALAPKLTAVAPVSAVPVIVTDVPPLAGPLFALTFVTVGGGR